MVPAWKPLYLSCSVGATVFAFCETVGSTVDEGLFVDGLCLPSGSNLTEDELARVVAVVQRVGQGS